MRKWALAGMLYVTAIVFGFQAYDAWIAKEEVVPVQAEGHSGQDMKDEGHDEGETGDSHSHATDTTHTDGSQVNAFIFNDQNKIKIYLKDNAGNPIDDLEITHEKLLHLVIVDEQLQKFYHIHPEHIGKGEFTISNPLPEGFYKAFIDIKPKNLAYEVEVLPFVVGNSNPSTHGHGLEPDKILSKNIDGEDVTLAISSYKANTPVELTFGLDQKNLTPYLGAIGHVVILDEYGKKFIHVHPTSNEEPVFKTQFDKPGIYKIWAEFQQNGKVRAFPFVIEIKE